MKISDTRGMIAGMTPERRPGTYVFATVSDPGLLAVLVPKALGTFREEEGLSLLLTVGDASVCGLAVDMPMAQITLNVFSALDGVGLTAAVATRLTERGIPCNVIAATQHDHVFVPEEMGEAALDALKALQAEAASKTG